MRYSNIVFGSAYIIAILSNPASAAPTGQDPIVSNENLSRWGYQQVKSLRYPRYYCDPKTITPDLIRYQSIKSLKPLANSRTFPRFNLVVETYSSVPLKNKRLRELEQQRGNSSIKISKTCLLRRVTSKGNSLYILHTDAALFSHTIMNSLMKRWKNTLGLK